MIREMYKSQIVGLAGYLGIKRSKSFMMGTNSFDNIIKYRLDKVKEEYNRFGKRLYE